MQVILEYDLLIILYINEDKKTTFAEAEQVEHLLQSRLLRSSQDVADLDSKLKELFEPCPKFHEVNLL